MDEYISRQAAIDLFDVPDADGMFTSCGYAMRELKKLPPAQQWIPCSERLPKKSGKYYVSGGDKVWICEFLIIPNFTVKSIGKTCGWCNNVSKPVVQAWMQPPEPYKGEEE